MKEKQRNDLLREVIKPLHEYTVEEKVKFFDSVYTSSLEALKQKKAGTLGLEIETQYDWESNMEILARDSKKFWNYWRSL